MLTELWAHPIIILTFSGWKAHCIAYHQVIEELGGAQHGVLLLVLFMLYMLSYILSMNTCVVYNEKDVECEILVTCEIQMHGIWV